VAGADASPLPPFSGVVLAGGRSTRMGTDKAFVEVDGRPLVAVVASVLEVAGAAEVFVVGGNAARLADLGLRTVPDDRPGAGPVAATVTALAHAAHDHVLVAACDLPDLGPRTITEIRAGLETGAGHPDVAVPVVDGRRQFLCAAYRRAAGDRLRPLVEAGVAAMHEAVDALHVVEVAPSHPQALRDVDTPAQLDEARARRSG
jgi:molybdopterin-guanine dinucleotide biosynthesis protein A